LGYGQAIQNLSEISVSHGRNMKMAVFWMFWDAGPADGGGKHL
jgi:hypothetical protein